MHDCGKTTERLVDLVFDELESEARQRLMAEVQGCQGCLAEYRSMVETLQVYDQATDLAPPDESYWPDYEERLRARLRLARPNLWQRLWTWISGLGLLIQQPLPMAAGLAMLLVAAGWYRNRIHQSKATVTHSPAAFAQITPSPEARPPVETAVVTPKAHAPGRTRSTRPPRTDRSLPPRVPEEQPVMVAAASSESAGADQPWAGNSLSDPETLRHFERAQLLLRSFRNAVSTHGISADLAYEKQLSRRLLYQNILLRRGAEARGNLPVEEVLENLEPFLLDIANLPERPSPGELGSIKQHLERKELIAELHLYSAPHSFPTHRNH